ncbi:MAG: sterol carrier family protein [Candidatus Nanopelagicales bacterium]
MQKDPEVALEVAKIFKLIKEISPGKAVELRVPPYGAIQCGKGVVHRRGTPANQVEMSADILIHLAINPGSWSGLMGQGQIRASGLASDLSKLFTQVSAKYQAGI